ncbi:MAG: CAP domain-containing protein, partial [Chloroflexota bacterium]|nr:CAP domain-containing protein [Chloroflexota bacterium]
SGGTFIFPPWWPIVFPTPKPPTHTPTPPPHATATRIPTQSPATATATQVPTQPPATATQVPTQPPATATQVPTQPPATATQVSTQPPATATQPAQPTATTAPASGVPSSGATRNGCTITTDQAQAEQYLFGLLNQHRAAAGARALQLNETISTASREHSCDMFQHQQLNHYGSDGSSPFQRISATGTSYSTAGENIGMAGGYGLNGGIDIIDNSMMAEPSSRGTHHWNIINAAYTQVGIGVIYANGQVWFTEDFVG